MTGVRLQGGVALWVYQSVNIAQLIKLKHDIDAHIFNC